MNFAGGVSQDTILGPLLWNIMYDGILRLKVPISVKLVTYTVGVAEVIVASY